MRGVSVSATRRVNVGYISGILVSSRTLVRLYCRSPPLISFLSSLSTFPLSCYSYPRRPRLFAPSQRAERSGRRKLHLVLVLASPRLPSGKLRLALGLRPQTGLTTHTLTPRLPAPTRDGPLDGSSSTRSSDSAPAHRIRTNALEHWRMGEEVGNDDEAHLGLAHTLAHSSCGGQRMKEPSRAAVRATPSPATIQDVGSDTTRPTGADPRVGGDHAGTGSALGVPSAHLQREQDRPLPLLTGHRRTRLSSHARLALRASTRTHHATADVHLLELRDAAVARSHRDVLERHVERVLGCWLIVH